MRLRVLAVNALTLSARAMLALKNRTHLWQCAKEPLCTGLVSLVGLFCLRKGLLQCIVKQTALHTFGLLFTRSRRSGILPPSLPMLSLWDQQERRCMQGKDGRAQRDVDGGTRETSLTSAQLTTDQSQTHNMWPVTGDNSSAFISALTPHLTSVFGPVVGGRKSCAEQVCVVVQTCSFINTQQPQLYICLVHIYRF